MGADQKPMTLCQFQSRARPVASRRNQSERLRPFVRHLRGHQSTRPLRTRKRQAALQAPVTALPHARWSPLRPRKRCQPSIARKNARHFFAPGSRMAPEYGST